MATKNGRLLICDRCGCFAFCECTGEGEMDGGYTRWNNFAAPPEGWDITRDCEKIHNLCPVCSAEYKKLIADFESRKENDNENQSNTD